jgi:hypothetical protein
VPNTTYKDPRLAKENPKMERADPERRAKGERGGAGRVMGEEGLDKAEPQQSKR